MTRLASKNRLQEPLESFACRRRNDGRRRGVILIQVFELALGMLFKCFYLSRLGRSTVRVAGLRGVGARVANRRVFALGPSVLRPSGRSGYSSLMTGNENHHVSVHSTESSHSRTVSQDTFMQIKASGSKECVSRVERATNDDSDSDGED